VRAITANRREEVAEEGGKQWFGNRGWAEYHDHGLGKRVERLEKEGLVRGGGENI